MSNIFHLAVEGGDLSKTVPFYQNVLGCSLGPFEKDLWQDIDFWGNELTLHQTPPRPKKAEDRERHKVDMGLVCVPHFGIHLEWTAYQIVKQNVIDKSQFLDEPYVRFVGLPTQQETFFIEDPNYNVIEIKSLQGTYYVDGER